MNSIIQAMQTAGVRLPSQTHRIWTWVQDHQPQSAKQIALALKLPQASSLLSQMEQRGMVTSTPHHDRSSGLTIKMFRVVGKEYEMLPLPFKPAVAKPTAQVIVADFKPVAAPSTAPSPTAFDLDVLTIAEARDLYKRLARMFKGEI